MTLIRRYFWFIVAGTIVVCVIYAITAQTQQRPSPGGRFRGGDAPVPVLAAAASRADVPIYLDGVGTTRALNTVTVRPQIDGKLIKISFKEGEDVERGDVIAEIDPTTYQAQLDQAKAKKAQDEAQLANARLDFDRYTRLAATNAVNRQQVDTQKAQVEQLEALVKLDQAVIDNAQAVLNYTKIIAPISGRTGIRLVDMGNILKASDATGIVMITQIRPISILFSLPQQQLARVNKAFAQGPLTVEAIGPDNKTIVDRGTLQVVDNQVDQTTGTVKLKAEFPNTDLQLWPGQFVNVRLLIETMREVVVVPTASVQRGPTGTFVYVIDDSKVSVRPVTVSQQDDTQTVVAAGLQPPERVVTTGFARLSEGSAVTVGSADTSEPPPPIGERPRRRRGEGAPAGAPRDDTRRGQQRSEATPPKSAQ